MRNKRILYLNERTKDWKILSEVIFRIIWIENAISNGELITIKVEVFSKSKNRFSISIEAEVLPKKKANYNFYTGRNFTYMLSSLTHNVAEKLIEIYTWKLLNSVIL